MKAIPAIATLVFTSVTLVADTLKIGAFNLPYRFEDTNITDIVRLVVTNDVQSFCAPITAFRPPYQDKNGNVCVQRINTPGTTLYRPEMFMQGIKFYIENGQTNCVIKQSLTDAAKAIEGELTMRTNIAASAQAFIGHFQSGATTNLPISARRTLMRTISNNLLLTMSNDIPDEEVIESQEEMRNYFSFFPICMLEIGYIDVGTNRFITAIVPLTSPPDPPYARSIDTLPLIYADGYWSFLY